MVRTCHETSSCLEPVRYSHLRVSIKCTCWLGSNPAGSGSDYHQRWSKVAPQLSLLLGIVRRMYGTRTAGMKVNFHSFTHKAGSTPARTLSPRKFDSFSSYPQFNDIWSKCNLRLNQYQFSNSNFFLGARCYGTKKLAACFIGLAVVLICGYMFSVGKQAVTYISVCSGR